MSRFAQIDVILAEEVERLAACRHQFVDSFFPRRLVIVGRHIPAVVGNAVEREFRRFGILHRIAAEARNQVADVKSVAIGPAHEQTALAVVVDGVIEPDECLALDLCVNPLHIVTLNHIDHTITCPHDAHFWVHLCAKRREIVATAPRLVVLGWADNERRHILVLSHESVGQIVHQPGLLLSPCTLSTDIIEENGKGADA